MDFMNHVLILQLNLKGPGSDGMISIFNKNSKHPTCAGVTGSGMICLIQ